MLGSAADAEDMVQDTYLRWRDRDRSQPVESTRSYLVTVVTRLCIDQLGSARAQRTSYTGPWLPEPVVIAEDEATVEQSDSLSLAFLVLLEELTPPERAAYLLHDVFGYKFDEVARSMGRTPASCRQLALRARRRIEDRRQRFDADLRHGQEMTRRFVVACATGDLDALMTMLSDDVVVWTDGGGHVRAAVRPVVGRHRSSRFLLNVAKKIHGVGKEVILNGQPAMVFLDGPLVVATVSLDIIDGQVSAVRSVTNPHKLERLSRALLASAGSGEGG
jgi:RNA polymerase sigma-70 factor (ECF subfamily)